MTTLDSLLATAQQHIHNHKYANAITAADKALTLSPQNETALFIKGVAHYGNGNSAKAKTAFQHVLSINPAHAASLYQLGCITRAEGQLNEAGQFFLKAFQANPQNTDYAHTLIHMLRKSTITEYNPVLEQIFLQLFTHARADVNPLFVPWYEIFKRSPHGLKIIQLLDKPTPSAQTINEAVENPSLILALANCRVRNYGLEWALTHTRKAILLQGLVEDISPIFLAALAIQNFMNEYVWNETEEETKAVESLIAAVLATPTPHKLGLLGAYRPLHHIKGIEAAASVVEQDSTGFTANLWQQQVAEPLREKEIRAGIKAITPIDDAISRKVQNQYEENPYPRWSSSNIPDRCTLLEYIHSQYPWTKNQLASLPDKPDILIAGCGTGKQAMDVATFFHAKRIEAVDLSLTSLSYAIRKQEEQQVDAPIHFAQADILKLGEAFPAESFDAIFCSGVLHHMNNPLAGWQVLYDLLKPGGVMFIGLYSEMARSAVNEAREIIVKHGYPSTLEGIRKFRSYIVKQPQEPISQWLLRMPDFYSVSDCRDLVFHVQEHQFTIPKIKEALETLGLEFLGFDESHIQAQQPFAQAFPKEKMPGSFAAWEKFEQQNPYAFSAMYQFIARKPA